MRFVTMRDLRNTPGLLRRLLAEGDAVLTAKGKPIAYLIRVENEDLDELSQVLRQARALRAVSRMREVAAQKGLAAMRQEEIEALLRKTRRQRAPSR